jgi:hypothetical protein
MELIQLTLGTLLMLIGGTITWFIKSKKEELRAAERRLQDPRRKLYFQTLEPYLSSFTDRTPEGQSKVLKTMQSPEYQRAIFELNLYASDAVISAHNRLREYTFEADKIRDTNTKEFLRLLGALLLEIRRSLGNKKTKLDEFDMLRAMIRDIESISAVKV